MKCVICKGTGNLPKPNGNRNYSEKELKRRAVKTLYDNNFSIRQIMSITGIKSIKTIQNLK